MSDEAKSYTTAEAERIVNGDDREDPWRILATARELEKAKALAAEWQATAEGYLLALQHKEELEAQLLTSRWLVEAIIKAFIDADFASGGTVQSFRKRQVAEKLCVEVWRLLVENTAPEKRGVA